MIQLKEQFERLNRGLKARAYGTILGITTMFPPKESSGSGYSREIVQFPPEPKVPDTVFSDVYQAEVPRDLYEAGIENLDVATGQAVLRMHGIIGGVTNLQEDAGFYCGLDLQDTVMRMHFGLGEHLQKVDKTVLVEQLGVDNPIVKLLQDAGDRYQATIGRKSNLDGLLEQFPNDPTAVSNRYYG